jgi:peroxiredoxin
VASSPKVGVVGISTQSTESHERFKSHHGLLGLGLDFQSVDDLRAALATLPA